MSRAAGADTPSPFEGTRPIASLTRQAGAVTLVEGQTFCLSGRTGDMHAALPHGLFFLDSRVLTTWELRVDDADLEPLTVDQTEPFEAHFLGRIHPPPGRADAEVVVFRSRHIGAGMREVITVVNHGMEPADLTVELRCSVDFADLFEVKEHRVRDHLLPGQPDGDALAYTRPDDVAATSRAVRVSVSKPAAVEPGAFRWTVLLPPRGSWEVCAEVGVSLDGLPVEPRFRCGGDDHDAVPARRMSTWRANLPRVDTDHPGLATALRRSAEDLGALRIYDPEHPDTPILAAGAPWFMAVFGRDSLLTAWMTLLAQPALARGVLETLARFQGDDVDAATEEQPGRILHEIRFGEASRLSLGGGHVYYGSIDATPLFVMLLGELQRWDPDPGVLATLLPHADRALAWIDEFGDRDGDGYVEYERASDRGLANQGWKDSWDGVRHADGRLAGTPIALCEVQGYVYAAFVARAEVAEQAGDAATAQRYRARAADLRARFNRDFWLEERGWFALGLDGDKRPIDALASNMGHCLWTGIVDADHAAAVAERLLAPELFSGWGIRTLATSMVAFNPISYHNGSVWPHDNAICAAGLARYGFVEEAHRVIGAQLDVAGTNQGRLPELFAGFERGHPPSPAAYPTSCVPQAWAAAAPLLWLRTLLRIDPAPGGGALHVAPRLPSWMGHLRVEGIEVAGRELTVEVRRGQDVPEIAGAGPLRVIREPLR